jgi:hypothetical protein
VSRELESPNLSISAILMAALYAINIAYCGSSASTRLLFPNQSMGLFRMPRTRALADAEDLPVISNKKPQELRSRQSSNRRKPIPDESEEFRFFVDRLGNQHFNFAQEVWLNTSVSMAQTPTYSVALKTLALNLLTLTLGDRNVSAARGATNSTALTFAAAFSKECLLCAPHKAWILPKSTIQSWLASKKRRRYSSSNQN